MKKISAILLIMLIVLSLAFLPVLSFAAEEVATESEYEFSEEEYEEDIDIDSDEYSESTDGEDIEEIETGTEESTARTEHKTVIIDNSWKSEFLSEEEEEKLIAENPLNDTVDTLLYITRSSDIYDIVSIYGILCEDNGLNPESTLVIYLKTLDYRVSLRTRNRTLSEVYQIKSETVADEASKNAFEQGDNFGGVNTIFKNTKEALSDIEPIPVMEPETQPETETETTKTDFDWEYMQKSVTWLSGKDSEFNQWLADNGLTRQFQDADFHDKLSLHSQYELDKAKKAAAKARADKAEKKEDLYVNPETGYEAIIDDAGGLLKDKNELTNVINSMKPITEYCNVVFATTLYNDKNSADKYARGEYDSKIRSGKGIVFLIDMDTRKIWIHSEREMYKTITTARANTITDNVYKLATNKEYAKCAIETFTQIHTILQGGKIAQPMKLIGCILIALAGGLSVCYLIIISYTKDKSTDYEVISEGMKNKNVSILDRSITKVYSRFIRDSSGDFGGGGGGGGGGFSGGGGGSSGGGGGGGGHSF